MIKLTKGPIPAWLATNQDRKTSEYISAPKDRKPNPWSQAELKEALKSECRSKCMYCEVNPEDGSYPAVEHIKPKESFPDLVLQWDNLGWCCTRCNTNKGKYWNEHEDLKLLNPYEDDPADHIEHAGPLVITSMGKERGKNTIRQLRLNRDSLFVSRAKRLQELDELIQIWDREDDSDKKTVIQEDIQDLLSQDSEFCAALRTFAALRNFPHESSS